MGSVKDLTVVRPPQENRPGRGRFSFSDRYSVFDWGGMPDDIPHKGEALCLLTAHFFERLEERGIPTHYRGLIAGKDLRRLDGLDGPSAEMEVDLLRVIEPELDDGEYDYSHYTGDMTGFLIPLEIIYRNTIPEHSSFRRRVDRGEAQLSDYGLRELPPPGVQLKTPVFDVSTKLESRDRYLSWEEARRMTALDRGEMRRIKEVLAEVNGLITSDVRAAGMDNLDGKIELGFDGSRRLMVVDAIGTPDECRFSYRGFHVGKEVIRQWYRSTDWYRELSEKKNTRGADWKDAVRRAPPALSGEMLRLGSQMYMASTNEITGREFFPGLPPLSEIIAGLREQLGRVCS